ncbi:MAG: TasA family protein [Clostridium sp.]
MRNKRVKRGLVSKALALVVVAAISIGATSAYFTDKQSVTNTFTVGDVKIGIEEAEWGKLPNHDIAPGKTLSKDPVIKNTGKNSCWMRVKVAYDTTIFELVGVDTTNWTLVGDYYYYNSIVPAAGKTSPVFTSVKMKDTVKESTITSGQLDVIVNAEAVQSDGFTTYTEAFNAAFPVTP